MPFTNRSLKNRGRRFEELDQIILSRIFPHLKWITYPPHEKKRIILAPNSWLHLNEREPVRAQDPAQYFALSCRQEGLTYAEIGLWLDTCLERFVVTHTDGVTRMITAEPESIIRFNWKRPLYQFNGIYRRSLETTPYT